MARTDTAGHSLICDFDSLPSPSPSPVSQSGDSDRLAFKLRLPVCSLLIGQLDDKQLFADLLSGDQLTARATCVVTEVNDDFNQVSSGSAEWGGGGGLPLRLCS